MAESIQESRTLMEHFRRVHHIVHKELMRSITSEFNPSSAMFLMRLWHRKKHGEEGLRVSELAAVMNITVPAVTQTVTALEAQGLVSRSMDPKDRRAILVTLTDEGSASLIPFFKAYSEAFDGLVEHLGEADTAELVCLLSRVEAYFTETLGLSKDRLNHERQEETPRC